MKKSSLMGMGIAGIAITLIINAGLFCGGVYFIFWCLRHFGIIG